MAFCKDCAYWRTSTLEPANSKIGVCQIDGKAKDDLRYGCMFLKAKKEMQPLKVDPKMLEVFRQK